MFDLTEECGAGDSTGYLPFLQRLAISSLWIKLTASFLWPFFFFLQGTNMSVVSVFSYDCFLVFSHCLHALNGV